MDVSRIDSHILRLNISRFDFVGSPSKIPSRTLPQIQKKREENVSVDFDFHDGTRLNDEFDQSFLVEGDKTKNITGDTKFIK